MSEDLRTCRKTGCRWPAAACMSYEYESRRVWLGDLSVESHPALWDLCPHHADRLVVPRGWELVDERHDRPAPVEPAGRDLAVGAVRMPGQPNRYAELSRDLPRLAAELAEVEQSGEPAVDARPIAFPPPSRELAPMPAPDLGQLTIPVDVDEPPGAAVLALTGRLHKKSQ